MNDSLYFYPMDSAPRDGRRVLLLMAFPLRVPVVAIFGRDGNIAGWSTDHEPETLKGDDDFLGWFPIPDVGEARKEVWHYRLLKHGDALQQDDEMLDHDCETWAALKDRCPTFAGATYDPAFHVPARRWEKVTR